MKKLTMRQMTDEKVEDATKQLHLLSFALAACTLGINIVPFMNCCSGK
jgi:hypothetical protein